MENIIDAKFSLSYKAIDGVTAILFVFDNHEWLVDPCALFNCMLNTNDSSKMGLLYLNKENLLHKRLSYYAKYEYDGSFVYWKIYNIILEPICTLRFVYGEYIQKLENTLRKLYDDTVHNKTTAYTGIIKLEEISKIFEQIKIFKLFYMPGRLRSSEVNEEKLVFDCPAQEENQDCWGCDIPYTLRIGNRTIASYISDWSNDIAHIRHQLESYCYCRSTQIDMNFEDSTTKIGLQSISTMASAKSIGSYTVYSYDTFMKVEIQPNSFVGGTAITGFCNEKDTIKELYEGLLNVGRIGYNFEEYGYDNDWDYNAMVFYNHVKSPIIERYVGNITEKYNTIEVRQTIINYVLTISPDYTHVLGTVLGQKAVVSAFSDDTITLYKDDSDEELCTVTLPGIYDWLDEFNSKSDGVKSTMGDMNVEEWHHRGLVLAKELKKKLPNDVDVWYGYPFEDVEHRNCRPILITEGTLKEYFEDELAIACLKKDKERIDYCLSMDADINANDGAPFMHLIASEKDIDLDSSEEVKRINNEKLELFEYLLTKGLIINHGKNGIDPILKLCKIWKCDLIENRINEIMKKH